jgi:DNA-3-methyladenine glycosylase
MPVRLPQSFFDRDPQTVAADLLGKVLCHRIGTLRLMALLVETEAYYLADKASHASLGFTEKRRALFMPPGTIYMYYARGGDSFNVSCRGAGNAVLFKAGVPHLTGRGDRSRVAAMQRRNPLPSGEPRDPARLCSGQTLLCRSLGLRVPEWDGRPLPSPRLFLLDVGDRPRQIIRTTRMGIPPGRDGHLPYRFVDRDRARFATRNPLGARASAPPEVQVFAYPSSPRDWRALASVEH